MFFYAIPFMQYRNSKDKRKIVIQWLNMVMRDIDEYDCMPMVMYDEDGNGFSG